MSAGSYDIYIERGATFILEMQVLDGDGNIVDLTGCSARIHFRRSINDPTVLDEFYTGLPGTPTPELSIDGSTGTIFLILDAAVTSAYNTWKRGVYDVEVITPDPRFPVSGEVVRLLEGIVESSPEVTRQIGP